MNFPSSRLFGRTARGFTLLELCIVLFIMALLAAAAMPAMDSAFVEKRLRDDAQPFSLLVRQAMLAARDQNRAYVLSLDGSKLTIAPENATDGITTVPASTSPGDDEPTPTNLTETQALQSVFKLPDAQVANKWNKVQQISWVFEPGGLCPLPRVRLEQGSAYIEMSFNALTGDVENEGEYLP